MSRYIGPLAAILLLLLLGAAGLKIAHDVSSFTAQKQNAAPRPPPPMMPSGLDGRSLNAETQPGKPKSPATPAVRR